MKPVRAIRSAAVSTLLSIATLHAAWAGGSSWPARDERQLAQAVIGNDRMPGTGPCLTVAALLTASAALVAGYPRRMPRMQKLGVRVVTLALGLRGAAGASGRMPNDRRSPTFARWNRRLYSPLCLLLAALCAYGGARNSYAAERS